MGRKKSNRPVRTRPLPSIPRIFDCPRCEATAIRISLQSDIALVECGNCLLKQTITNIKQIEEPVDIFGNFVDEYYKNLDLSESPFEDSTIESTSTGTLEPQMDQSTVTSTEMNEIETETEELQEENVLEEVEEEQEEEKAQLGLVLRSKSDVLKKKNKDKDNKKNKKASFSL